MAEREIKIGFPEAKMEALEFFLKENDTTVEKVLRAVSYTHLTLPTILRV